MLQNFIICVNAVIPSAIYLIIGIILRTARVVSEEDVRRFTRAVFVSLYPFVMFDNLYGKNIADNIDLKLGFYALGFTALQFAVSWVFVCAIEKDGFERGPMIQALYRSNYVLMGVPIAVNLFGKGNIAAVAIVMMLVVPFYNISAVIIFETFRGGKVSVKDMLRRIATNPIIDGGIAAFITMMLGITLPDPIYNTIGTLSDATAPVAMILLGAALNLSSFSSDRKRIGVCAIGKLIVYPALGIAGAVLIGLRGAQLIAITLMTAAPVALSSFPMASSMGGNGKLAGELVVITTITSCFTIPIFLFILKNNGLF